MPHARTKPAKIDWTGRISKCGDKMLRSYLYEAANVLLTRVAKWSVLKAWASGWRSEAGFARPRLPSPESLPSSCTGCGLTAPSSIGHRRRPPLKAHNRIIEFPPTSGRRRPCRDDGGGEIAPGFAMLQESNRASHIDPPASSYAIMRRAYPYRGENRGPGEDVDGELDRRPGIREQPGSRAERLASSKSGPRLLQERTQERTSRQVAVGPIADIQRACRQAREVPRFRR